MNTTIITLLIIGAVVIIGVILYNSLVTKRNRVKEAWSDIEVQLKRRYDLIPNLVSTVKGSANFESSTLEKVISARSKAMQGGTHEEIGKAENELSGTLKTIFALSENYPDLKSNQNFLSLQGELSDTEDKIQSARRFYNGNVMELNNAVQTVPTNFIAKMFDFKEETFFELDDAVAKEPVKVSF
jgi:LemA protein